MAARATSSSNFRTSDRVATGEELSLSSAAEGVGCAIARELVRCAALWTCAFIGDPAQLWWSVRWFFSGRGSLSG